MYLGFTEIVISVHNLERAADALVAVAGYRRRDLPPAAPDAVPCFGSPAGCRHIEQVFLIAAGETRRGLRLVRFAGCEGQIAMRSSQRTWDTGGIFDFDAYVDDARRSYAALQRRGWTAFGDPVDYEWGGFSVCEVVAVGPSGIVVGLLQPHTRPSIPVPEDGTWTRPFNSAQIVADYDRALGFYVGTLGWKVLVDTRVDDAVEPGFDVLGIPMPYARTVVRRVGIVHPTGVNDGSIELLSLEGLAGHDYGPRCVAPNIGFLSYRFFVPDADAYAAEISGRGGELVTLPSWVTLEPYGRLRSFAVRSPDGALLEFLTEPGGADHMASSTSS